jgi:aldehyde dehydrogenase (NAD+)
VKPDLAEITPVCIEANLAIRNLKSWMKSKGAWPSLLIGVGTRSEVQYVPRGRVLIIGPFNYPINLLLGPLISAVAAGNAVILKPSELTPNISALIALIIRQVFKEDEVAIFQGEADVATALLALPFDHIFFTGSPAVGKIVMTAAAKNLSSVTLELGGKSPTIIDSSANIKLAAQNVVFGKFANSGQTCIAPDYVFVQESVKAAFVEELGKEIARAYGESIDDQRTCPGLAHMVNQRHYVRVKALLDDATALGAQALFGGGGDASDDFIQPTVLDNIPVNAKIMEEEIFGPLLPIFTFSSLDDVISKINSGPKPLAIYLYSHTSANVKKVLSHTASGGACINGSLVQFLHGNLPFGGIGNSGQGNAHGLYGFKAFSHERAVVHIKLPLLTALFKGGAMPKWQRSAFQAGFKWV